MGAAAVRCLLLKPVLLRRRASHPKIFSPTASPTVASARLPGRGNGRRPRSDLPPALRAYLREGAIAPNAAGTFTDPYDDLPNVRIFGLYIDDELASSIRIHVTSPEHAEFPSHVYSRTCSIPSSPPAGDRRPDALHHQQAALAALFGPAPRHTAALLARSRAFPRRAFPGRDPFRAPGVLPAHLPASPDLRCPPLPAAGKADQPDDGRRPARSPIRSISAIRSSDQATSSAACCSSGICSPPCRRPRPSSRSTTTGRRFKVASDAPRTMPQKKGPV